MGRTDRYGKMGFVLSGRNALSLYGLCSDDENVIFFEVDEEFAKQWASSSYWCSPSKENEIHELYGYKVSSMEKALMDLIETDYDDSAVFEVFDCMSEEEYQSFIKYLKKNNKYDEMLNDPKYGCLLVDRGAATSFSKINPTEINNE